MNKILLLAILYLCATSLSAQTSASLYCYGTAGSFTTGSTDGATRYDDSIIVTGTSNAGYAVFDLSSIPAGSVISSCSLVIYIGGFTAGTPDSCRTYGIAMDLSTVTDPAILLSDITSGVELFSGMPPGTGSYGGGGPDSINLSSSSAPVTTFIQSHAGSKISLGFTGGGTNRYLIEGELTWGGLHLTINYTPPCSGTPAAYFSSSDSTACATSSTTFNNSIYYGGGMTYQWQSSPDSTTWSNISGATDATYINSGITTTTFFRCQPTCTFSGLTANSAGKKLAYLACCTGTPMAGTATASTTSCNDCLVTLSLTGTTPYTGLSYSWQYSADSISWYALDYFGGSPDLETTQHVNWGALFYRCLSSCAFSGGLTSFSDGVYVGYHYNFASATMAALGSPCGDPTNTVIINGKSPTLSLETQFGDGTSIISSGTDTSAYTTNFNESHHYSYPGTYTIKEIIDSNGYAIDSTFFPFNNFCHVIKHSFFYDYNSDCIMDDSDFLESNPIIMSVDSNGYTIDTVCATSGNYYLAHGPVGTIYKFTLFSNNAILCNGGISFSDTITSATYLPEKTIGVICMPGLTGFDLAVQDVIPVTGIHRQLGDIYVSNYSCLPFNAVVTLHYDRHYNILEPGGIKASPLPSSYTDSTATWDLSNVTEFSSYIDKGKTIDINYGIWTQLVGTDAPIGYPAKTYVSISPTVGDTDPSNNTEMIIDTVRAGCDPNIMSVSPAGCLPTDTSALQLQYTISFTNVGNDTAFNISIIDTLPNAIDPKSLRILLASNTMYTLRTSDSGYNIVKFDFPGINLLDTTDCPLCSGAVIFTINLTQGLPDGTAINNRAGVYFDDNPVDMTNTVTNTTGCAINEVKQVSGGSKVSIYPNPATATLYVRQSDNSFNTCYISNPLGQVVSNYNLTGLVTTTDISSLPAGLYFVTLTGPAGNHTEKIVKR